MECRPLEVTVISASDLEKVRDYFPMHPYVVAFLYGDERHKKEQSTPVDEGGGTSPRWDHALAYPFTVDVAAALAGHLTLVLVIKTRRTLKYDRHVGWVGVPVKELLEQSGDGESREPMSYHVTVPESRGIRGVLKFSYRFGKSFTVHDGAPYQPPANQQPPVAGRPGWRWLAAVILGFIPDAVSECFGDGSDM